MLIQSFFILFYLASQVIPVDKKATLQIMADGQPMKLVMRYDNSQKAWKVYPKEAPSTGHSWIRVNTEHHTVSMSNEEGGENFEVNLSKMFRFPSKPDWRTLKSLEVIQQSSEYNSSPLILQSLPRGLILQQVEGELAPYGDMRIEW